MAMSDQGQPDLVKQVYQIDFEASLRHEQEQAAALRQLKLPLIPSWLLILIWVLIGAVICGGGVFLGWLAWRH
jgi:hypothetical protein